MSPVIRKRKKKFTISSKYLLLILCARVCPGASLVAVPPGVPAGGPAVKGQDKRRTALDGLPPAR